MFFRKKYLINKEGYDIKGPFIMVSNHPSTLTDVMNAAKQYDGYIHFLANAGMFKNPLFGGFLKNTFAIPIERPVDVGGGKIDNEASFKYCYEHLGKGGNLYIAAEGGSKLTRRIRKLKTGTARIALKSESLNDFNLNIRILPVGVVYAAPKRFKSDFLLNVGKPIAVKDYRKIYDEDAFQAARALTDDLAMALQELVLHTDEKDHDIDKMVRIMEEIHQSEKSETLKTQFPLSKKWIGALEKMKGEDGERFEEVKGKVFGFCEGLVLGDTEEGLVLSRGDLKQRELKREVLSQEDLAQQGLVLSQGDLKQRDLKQLVLLVLGFVPAVFGYLNNFLLYHGPKFILKKTKLYPGYTSTVYLIFGLIFLPITYAVLFFIVKWISGYWWIGLLYLLIAFLLGHFAVKYFRFYRRYQQKRSMNKFRKVNPDKYKALQEQRKEIVDFIHTLS